MLTRRHFMALASGAAASTLSGCRWWPTEGLSNPCLPAKLPKSLARHAVVLSAWQGIDPARVWDCHVHLTGVGDSRTSGIYLNPDMRSLLHPQQYAQFKFYMNATCAMNAVDAAQDNDVTMDEGVVARLVEMVSGLPDGVKLMLLAFAFYHDINGNPNRKFSAFHIPNAYAREIAARYPDRFEWIASIHPYTDNSVTLLEQAITQGARAVKWLPGAMGIDPASPKCDPFYETLARTGLPLLVHTGTEHAIETPAGQALGNPLLLRRALEHKVKLVMAHCATTGQSIDLDKGANGPLVDNFVLFKRLMSNPAYETNLYGDISAVTQVNRSVDVVRELVSTPQWHARLLFGSDYPLPGVMPLVATSRFVEGGGLSEETAKVLIEIRKYNVILYDFLLKRHLQFAGQRFANGIFETRAFFLRRSA